MKTFRTLIENYQPTTDNKKLDEYRKAIKDKFGIDIEKFTNNKIKGGKADNLTPKDIADKFDVSTKMVKDQIKKGIKIEMEHTGDKEKATEIAMDHLTEFPDYYDRLEKMEAGAKKELGLNEGKNLIKRLLNENLKKNSAIELINEFGMLISLNFTQITKMGKDETSTNELIEMMKNLRKPIINGLTYFELIQDVNSIITNPKFLSVLMNKIREFLIYIKPRIERFVIDNDFKTKWLEKINRLTQLYKIVIS
jgi:hypothetical protein